MLTSAVSDVRGPADSARPSSSLSPDRSWETLVSLSHLEEPSSLFGGKEKKSEQLELISAQWSWDTLSVGLTAGCRQLWGEGARAHPGWTSFLSSQRLRLQAEVCRELELPERSEDRESEGGGHGGFRFQPKLCWRPSASVQERGRRTRAKGDASEYGNVLLAG